MITQRLYFDGTRLFSENVLMFSGRLYSGEQLKHKSIGFVVIYTEFLIVQ